MKNAATSEDFESPTHSNYDGCPWKPFCNQFPNTASVADNR